MLQVIFKIIYWDGGKLRVKKGKLFHLCLILFLLVFVNCSTTKYPSIDKPIKDKPSKRYYPFTRFNSGNHTG